METVMLYNQFDDWIKAHSLDEETDLAEIERILAKVLKGFSLGVTIFHLFFF